MDKEATKKMTAIIGSGLLSCVLVFMFIWSVVFVRYGDHAKYDLDIVITIQLGIGIASFFMILSFIFYNGMVTYADYVSDKKIRVFEEEYKRIKEKG